MPAAPWRKRLLEACATVARAASKTESGTMHTIQLMQVDPAFRAEAMTTALNRTKPMDGGHPSAVAEYQRVQRAVDKLRAYDGRVL